MNRQREADADRRHRGRAVVAVAHQGAVGSGSGSASRIAAHDPVLDHLSAECREVGGVLVDRLVLLLADHEEVAAVRPDRVPHRVEDRAIRAGCNGLELRRVELGTGIHQAQGRPDVVVEGVSHQGATHRRTVPRHRAWTGEANVPWRLEEQRVSAI